MQIRPERSRGFEKNKGREKKKKKTSLSLSPEGGGNTSYYGLHGEAPNYRYIKGRNFTS